MHAAQSGSSLIVAGTRPSAARWQRYVRPDQLYRQARVVGLVRQTDSAISVTLAPMDGQPCDALAGQYLTLIAEIDGRRIKRAYSLSQPAGGKTFTITCKEIRNGEMSFHINRHLKEGDLLQFAGPSGDFVIPDPAPAHSVFVAAGSGITPVMAMLEQLLEHDRCALPVTLVYGNRREKDILFRSRLDALAERHPQLSIRYVLSKPTKNWQGEQGRVDVSMLPVLSGGHYFLCGPDSFNNDLRDGLLQQGIPPTAISIEHFTGSTGESRPHPTEPHPVLFRLPDGSEQEVTVRPGESILEAGLRGSPVDVNILGEVNSAIETGEVLITLLSDANGYLIENPFSASPGAPRYALLDMDAAMTAEGTIANAALSQNLLNIQVVGLAIVEDGILVMDAVAVVEPEILGLERANGLLSFRLEAYADQRNAPVPPADTRPLALQSWSPGEQFQPNARPGDPIILNFNKPLDAGSVFLDGAIQIRADGMLVSDELAPMRHDGATVIIDGSNLQHNIDIDIDITSLLRDTQGNPLSQDQTLSLRLDDLFLPGGSAANLRAPLAAVFPGFSCALTGAILTGERDTWRNGRCVGGNNSDPLFHVDNLYKDYPIRVLFSRSIDPATINENTLFVERRDESNSWVPEPGRLDIQPQRVDFFPDTPWQIGALYRYTLRSVPNNPDCGVNAICTPDGAPLQTRQISQSSNTAPASREGGPNMVNHFVAAGEADRYTLVGLRALPVADVNGNATMDDAEQGAVVLPGGGVEAPPNHLRLRLKSTGGVITNANLGCEIGQSCPEKRFAFISSGALAAGPRIYDPDVTVNRRLLDGNPATDDVATGAIEADIFPTIVTTTSVFLEARALGLIDIGLDTGPLILRLVPQQATQTVIPGFISDTEDGPWFNTTFDVLVDAPELEPRLIIELGHDIRSKRVTNVTLEGPLRFVDDGRLILKISNPDPLIIPANINLLGIGLASVELEVPSLALDMTLTFLPVKDF